VILPRIVEKIDACVNRFAHHGVDHRLVLDRPEMIPAQADAGRLQPGASQRPLGNLRLRLCHYQTSRAQGRGLQKGAA
jgi:hypothetical protein